MTQVRIAAISHYTELLESLGQNPTQLLVRNGFDANFFDEKTVDQYIDYAQVEHLLQLAASASGCEHFGALLGSKQSIHFLGPLALVLMHAQTLRQALELFEQLFAYHVQEGSIVSVSNYGKLSSLTYTVTADLPSVNQTNELAMAEGMVALQALCGKSWRANSVRFTHKPPRHINAYNKIFNVPLHFNQEKNEIIFSSSDLNRRIHKADQYIQSILSQQIAQQGKILPNDTRGKIEATVRLCMLNGNYSIDEVARKSGMHKRALQRALQGQSTSYTQIVNHVRKGLATERLRHSDMSVVQLASLLGYTDSSTFNRAFKRWFNTTPMLWRTREREAIGHQI